LPVKRPPPCQQSPFGSITSAFRYGACAIAVHEPFERSRQRPFVAK
jgi:hypothetical protein